MSTITVQSPIKVAAPRGAAVAAALAFRLLNWIEDRQRARAQRIQHAKHLGEASALRLYAMRFEKHDPHFASDLNAAADRHERGL